MINVLLVDDEALTRDLHRQYLARLEGYRVVGEAGGAKAALAELTDPGKPTDPERRIDLVLLDVTMADGTGLDVLRAARARGIRIDVITISGVRDVEVVRQAVGLGVAHYLVKPFTWAMFRERLEAYRAYREQALAVHGSATQAEIDSLFGVLRSATPAELPKGLSLATLERVAEATRTRGALSAREAATELGMSRVSARRYPEHLAAHGIVRRDSRYGTGGRPETEYRAR